MQGDKHTTVIYTYGMAMRDSDRALYGYRRRQQDEPSIDSAALVECLRTLVTVWSLMAAVALSSVAIASQITV